MEQWIQFVINIIVALAGIFAGRFWERYDRQSKKDKELIEKIFNLLPFESGTLYFLRKHDFGSRYENGTTKPIWELQSFLNEQSYFFINKKLEKARNLLKKDINDFEALISKYMFVSDRIKGYWELANPDEVIREKVMYRKSVGKEMSEDEYNEYSQMVRNKHNKIVEDLNLLANNICKNYDNLASLARRVL